MLAFLVVCIAAVVLVFNSLVSRHVWADHRRTKQERIAEVGLIWCVPVFGGLVALAISAESPAAVRRSRSLFGSAAGVAATSSWTDGSDV